MVVSGPRRRHGALSCAASLLEGTAANFRVTTRYTIGKLASNGTHHRDESGKSPPPAHTARNAAKFNARSIRRLIARRIDRSSLADEILASMRLLGHIQTITRYPVKSMAGVALRSARLDWNGLAGDRRFGVHRLGDNDGFPWISASRLPELLLYKPCEFSDSTEELLPTKVCTPSGTLFDILGDELRSDISNKLGFDVELMKLKHGIFDDSPISLIANKTISHVCENAGVAVDPSRFRANIVVDLIDPFPFAEDEWIGSVIRFGKQAAIYATKRDLRCKMIGLDPASASYQPALLKSAVELNENHAGVYGTAISTGSIEIGDEVMLCSSGQ